MVALRLVTPEAPTPARAAGLDLPRTKAPVPGGRSVLLVEDHAPTADAIVAALGPTDRVTWVRTPAAAWARIVACRFDAAFVSLAFPNHAGMRFMTELRRNTDMAIIAIVRGRDFFAANYQTRMATLMAANGTIVAPVSAVRAQVVLDQAVSLWAAQSGKVPERGTTCRDARFQRRSSVASGPGREFMTV